MDGFECICLNTLKRPNRLVMAPVKTAFGDEGGRTIVLQLPKGFRLEGHSHTKSEQHFVLKGQYELEGRTCSEGTYQLIHAEMSHGPFTSETGAEILVIWN